MKFCSFGAFFVDFSEARDLFELFFKFQGLTAKLSHPVPRNRERSLHTCAQDVQITRMATI
jgi:hypothetical protein